MDLTSMTVAELKKLQGEIEIALVERQKADLQAAKDAASAAAAEFGFTLVELVSAKTGSAKPKAAPKYRNPDNPEQTWTGRGRKPHWVNEALNAGKDISELEI